eukprot:6533240-Alexandrium_andersonii.AAC.1
MFCPGRAANAARLLSAPPEPSATLKLISPWRPMHLCRGTGRQRSTSAGCASQVSGARAHATARN